MSDKYQVKPHEFVGSSPSTLMKANVIKLIVSIAALLVVLIISPWLISGYKLLFPQNASKSVLTKFPNCILESTLVSTSLSKIYLTSDKSSLEFSLGFKVGENDHYIQLYEPSFSKDDFVQLPIGTKLILDGYVMHKKLIPKDEYGSASEANFFRGSIGEDTVWIKDNELDSFQWQETYDQRHPSNEATLIAMGFSETERGDKSYLDMPFDWQCS